MPLSALSYPRFVHLMSGAGWDKCYFFKSIINVWLVSQRERDTCAKNDNSLGKEESLNLMARRTKVTSLTDKQPQPGYNNLRLWATEIMRWNFCYSPLPFLNLIIRKALSQNPCITFRWVSSLNSSNEDSQLRPHLKTQLCVLIWINDNTFQMRTHNCECWGEASTIVRPHLKSLMNSSMFTDVCPHLRIIMNSTTSTVVCPHLKSLMNSWNGDAQLCAHLCVATKAESSYIMGWINSWNEVSIFIRLSWMVNTVEGLM